MIAKAMFSSAKDDWQTPPELFAKLHAEFCFDADVAANNDNHLCPTWLGPGGAFPDALDKTVYWGRANTVWMNPPYSRVLQRRFIQKASSQRTAGTTTVALLPARTDTKAFHAYVWNHYEHRPYKGVEVRFLPGRLKFVGAKHGAPFPSMVVVFRGRA
jgi:phage N-6-adenine-methyltransferase